MAVAVMMLATSPAVAQNLFTPVAKVNDQIVTGYEFSQRVLMLELLGSTGDLEAEAREQLVDERLQMQAAGLAGINVSAAEIQAGVDEFAARTDATGDEFLASLADQGIAPESFRAFITVGVAWRQFVRRSFAPLSQPTDADIDRAISLANTRGSARVLISEIFLPTNTPENAIQANRLAIEIAKIRTTAEFSDAARRFSAGPSRDQGGRVRDWVPITNLPPQIGRALLTMTPGDITVPLTLPDALVLIQLRALQESPAPAPKNPEIDYAAYYIAARRGQSAQDQAASIQGRVDRCDDLYGIAKDQPPEVLERNSLPLSDIPNDVAFELARLDVGEVSTALTRANGQTVVFLMLCGRSDSATSAPSRDVVKNSLLNQRMTSYADTHLEILRAEARIIYP